MSSPSQFTCTLVAGTPPKNTWGARCRSSCPRSSPASRPRCRVKKPGNTCTTSGAVGAGRRGQGARRDRVDEGVGRVLLVGEDLCVLARPRCRRHPSSRSGVPVVVQCPRMLSRWPQQLRVRRAWCSRGWSRRSRRRTSTRNRPRAACSPGRRWTRHRCTWYPAGRGGIGVAHRTGHRRRVEGGVQARKLGQAAVPPFLVGDDQLLYGHRLGWRNRWAGPWARAPRAHGRS